MQEPAQPTQGSVSPERLRLDGLVRGTGPLGIDLVYDKVHVERHFEHITALLWPLDVVAVTIHRTGGDHRYEWAPKGADPTQPVLKEPYVADWINDRSAPHGGTYVVRYRDGDVVCETSPLKAGWERAVTIAAAMNAQAAHANPRFRHGVEPE